MIRIPIGAPYVDAKKLLLQTVAGAGHCRTVFDNVLDLSTLAGFPDVEAYERYKRDVAEDEDCRKATARFNETKCFSAYERNFLVPMFE